MGVRDDKCYTCGRANPGLWGFAPLLRQFGADLGFIQIVIGGSTALYALSLLTSGRDLQIAGGGISFLVPSVEALLRFGASGYYPVFVQGAWWTLLSASWLHASLLHILFNMMWVRQLAPVTADIIGPSRTVIVYTIAGVTGFLFSSSAPFIFGRLSIPLLHVAPFTVGASASIFGLLGTLVHYGRRGGSSLVGREAMRYALLLFIFGLLMPGVDNFAHAGGFVGGYAASAVMDPLTRERGDHTLVAVACLAATFLAILFSVLQGFTLQA